MLVTNFNIRQRTDAGVGDNFVMEPMTGKDAKTDNYHLHVILHTEKEDITVYSINGIKIYRDYKKNYGDMISANCKVSIIDYMTKIYPNKENLELTLVLNKIQPLTGNVDTSIDKVIEYYKVVLDNSTNLPYDESMYHKEPNREETIEVKMQLIDLGVEVLRNKVARGCFNYNDNKELGLKQLLETVIKKESADIKVMQKPVIDAIDISKVSNQGKVRNLMLPDSVKLFDIADYIQTHGGGLYAEGAGLYVQRYRGKKIIFVYPVYRCTKKHFDETPYRKAEIVLTASYDVMSDSSTVSSENFVKFVGYGNINTNNTTTHRELNRATGFTSMDSELLASYDSKKVFEDKLIPTIARKPFVIEVKDGKVKMLHSNLLMNRVTNIKREDKIEVVNSSIQHATNLFNRASDLVKNRVEMAELFWPNALLYEIYPSMPCRIRYFDKKSDVKEVYGCIVACEYNLIKTGRTDMHNEFKTHAKLIIALNRYPDEEETTNNVQPNP